MPPVYIVEQGAKLSIEKQRLIISKSDETIAKIPLAHTSAIVIFGNVSITTPAMKRLMQRGIDTVFLTRTGSYEGRLVGPLSKFGLLRQTQYARLTEPATCLMLAQPIVAAKCHNMRVLLMRHQRRNSEANLTDICDRLEALKNRTQRTTTLNALRGVEGTATSAYFQGLRHVINPTWLFERRIRRPPTDPVNVLLSFGYTLLARAVEAAVLLVGLDPHIGILHRVEYGRPSLALDLMEEFRSLLVDSVVLRCINTGSITLADFTAGEEPSRPIILSDGARRRFIEEIEARMETRIEHPTTHEQMTYRRALEIQVRLLARCLRDGTTDYQPFRTR